MKKLSALLFVVGLGLSFNANAWFFFFLPTGAIADAITGSSGDNCVAESTKVGDKITFKGDVWIVKSLSGTSSRCSNEKFPIRAELEKDPTVGVQASTNAQIDIPEGYANRDLTEAQKKGNAVFWVLDKNKDSSMMLYSINRSNVTTMNDEAYAEQQLIKQGDILDISVSAPTKKLTINGANAWQKEITGVLKSGNYKKPITYLITLYAGDEEFVMLKQWTNEPSYPAMRSDYENTLLSLKNITAFKSSDFQTPAKVTKVMGGNSLTKNSTTSLATSTSVITPTFNNSTEKKLQDLKSMLDKGLITKQDYDAKKAEILKSM
jgi:hypothetical protein